MLEFDVTSKQEGIEAPLYVVSCDECGYRATVTADVLHAGVSPRDHAYDKRSEHVADGDCAPWNVHVNTA